MTEEVVENKTDALESIALSDGSSILRLPDLDGEPIYFLSYRIAKDDKGIGVPSRDTILEDVARPDLLLQGELNNNQAERLHYALEQLKLPSLLAVHAALNTELDLTQFEKPDTNTPYPVMLSMNGRPGVGKSFVTAMLSIKEGYQILNFDSVSGYSSEKYVTYIESKANLDDPSNLTINEGWKLANETKQNLGVKNGEIKTLRQMLDIALEKVVASKNRAELYLCDMPGMPGIYDFGTGRTYGKERKYDIVDFLAWESCESGILSTHQLTDFTMERKLNWLRDDIIGKYINDWRMSRTRLSYAVKKLTKSQELPN